MNYQVIIHDAEEGGYWAEVTGMPGCYSQGETLAETKASPTFLIIGKLEKVSTGS